MIDLAIRRAVRCPSFVTPLLCIVGLLCAAGSTFTAVVGDHVELIATHQAGVPFHKAPSGTQPFQRIPSGTVGTVIGIAREASWLRLSLADGRTG